MQQEGPPLEALTRRLAECPPEFLADPRAGAAGQVHTAALIADLWRDLGGTGTPALDDFRVAAKAERNRLLCAQVAAWLFHDPWFGRGPGYAPQVLGFLNRDLRELARLVPARQLVEDGDRREELARLALKALGLRPAGETAAQAEDRLTTLSSLERQRLAAAAADRARQVQEAAARQAAEEAAARYGRE